MIFEAKKKGQGGWTGTREWQECLVQEGLPVEKKGVVHKTTYETRHAVCLRSNGTEKRRKEAQLKVADLRMLQFLLRVTSTDRVKYVYIKGIA